MASLPLLPNPLTPLAWLPPDIAGQLEASRYLYAATVGAWIWDFLMSLPEEVRMFTRYRLSFTDVVYVCARMSSCAFILTSLIFQVAPVANCHILAKAIGWCGAFALPLNSLLFFFRIRAVFGRSNAVITFFGFLWLATFAAISAPFGVDGTHIGTTMFCVNSDVQAFSSAGIVVVAVHDTMVFLAITTRLVMYCLADTWFARFKAFFSGKGMGNVSKALLQTGQMYYLATVGMNIVAMVLILTPSVPPVLRAMFAIPNAALQNTMACRVYRKLKLGLIKEDSPSLSQSTFSTTNRIRFAQNSAQEFSTTESDLTSMEMSRSVRSAKHEKPLVVRVEVDEETDAKSGISASKGDRQDWTASDFA
ncbi:hypothetical protein EUX98_g2912 [Antrodiella citrinella]|uniref:DUF6533 domain-containing protein n=1 Tax=Antrodiella citrinella TaxID=2447956 RepID=A0A4V3XJ06_9APHY|nr:hypothetical protein EUX98_g2912 [Antrodiella citrinella]